MAKAADFEAPALEGEAGKGKGRCKGKAEGKGKKAMTAEEKEKKDFNKDLATPLCFIYSLHVRYLSIGQETITPNMMLAPGCEASQRRLRRQQPR